MNDVNPLKYDNHEILTFLLLDSYHDNISLVCNISSSDPPQKQKTKTRKTRGVHAIIEILKKTKTLPPEWKLESYDRKAPIPPLKVLDM